MYSQYGRARAEVGVLFFNNTLHASIAVNGQLYVLNTDPKWEETPVTWERLDGWGRTTLCPRGPCAGGRRFRGVPEPRNEGSVEFEC